MATPEKSGEHGLPELSRPYLLAFGLEPTLVGPLELAADETPVDLVLEYAEVRSLLRREAPPALIVVGADDGGERGAAVARMGRQRWPRTSVVVVGMRRSSRLERVGGELEAKIIVLHEGLNLAVRSIRRQMREGARVRDAQRALAAVFAARWKLSKRQHECVRLLAFGVPQNDLPERLGISTRAVDQHLRNIRDRCGEVESCGVIQRLLELAIETGMRGEASWLRQLR